MKPTNLQYPNSPEPVQERGDKGPCHANMRSVYNALLGGQGRIYIYTSVAICVCVQICMCMGTLSLQKVLPPFNCPRNRLDEGRARVRRDQRQYTLAAHIISVLVTITNSQTP